MGRLSNVTRATIDTLARIPRTPDDLLARDLSADPPPGLPRLTAREATLLRHRWAHPDLPWAQSARHAGYSETIARRGPHIQSARVSAYLAALGRLAADAAVTVVSQYRERAEETVAEIVEAGARRERAIARLDRAVTEADDREAIFAAKVLIDALPAPDAMREQVRELSDADLRQRVREAYALMRSLRRQHVGPERLRDSRIAAWAAQPIAAETVE